MSARDLAAEMAADNAAKELASLRALRDAVLRMGRLLRRANGDGAPKEDQQFLLVAFDHEGMGPFVVPVPELTGNLVLLALDAQRLEVLP